MNIQCVPASILGIITVIAVLCLRFRWFRLKKVRSFYVWVGVLAVLGGAWAFLFPLAINADFSKDGDGAALRQMLIYTTGGVLGVITLGENHRKNSLEKFKNDQDHIRQVHSERRSRYTTAIEQLSNETASTRLGGVYTLVGLVDEWLADEKAIPNIEERRKEGQVIINNLCAYIRSPFLLAERAEQLNKPYAKDLQKDFAGDKDKFDADKRAFAQEKAALEEERQVRQSIIKEIREHLHNNEELGPWSGFDYDFSNTLFFYSTNFMFSHFNAFTNFYGVTFTQNAAFSGAKFTQNAYFSGAEFTSANFSGATFTQNAYFSGAKFTEYADFSKAEFTSANFSKAEFTSANFSQAEFTSANFSKAEFTSANFSEAEFTGDADFSEAEFIRASFSEAEFIRANFSEAEFIRANFSEAEFTEYADFSEATFEEKPIFERALGDKTCKAKFSCKADPEDYNFEVSYDSPYKIETEEQEHNGVKFTIPKGAELFDPDRKATVTVNNYIYTQNDRLNFIATKKNR